MYARYFLFMVRITLPDYPLLHGDSFISIAWYANLLFTLRCSNSIPDCLYHPPHCECVDPLIDRCFLAFPHNRPQFIGPFNRIRGQKLIHQFQSIERFRNRLLLVDDDVKDYLHFNNPAHMPTRFFHDLHEYMETDVTTPLLQQEISWKELVEINSHMSIPVTADELRRVQVTEFERRNVPYVCYCARDVDTGEPGYQETVMCNYKACTMKSFHRPCISSLGYNKVTNWYCTYCEYEMENAARQFLLKIDITHAERRKLQELVEVCCTEADIKATLKVKQAKSKIVEVLKA